MKIVALKAENIKKIKAIEIVPEGNVIKITGANEEGKSTVLDSIWYGIGGGKNLPEVPLRIGTNRGEIVLDLGEIVVKRIFTKDNTRLEVTNGKGMAYRSPQDVLDKLISKFSFDAWKFAKAKGPEQFDSLIEIVDLRVDEYKIREITGAEVVIGKNAIETIAGARKGIFDARTITNRQLKDAEGALNLLPIVNKTESKPVAELLAEKERLQNINIANEKVRDKHRDWVLECNAGNEDIATIDDEIRQLEKDLRAKREKMATKREELTNIEEQTAKAAEDIAQLKDEDLTDINQQIATIDETNKKANQWQEREKARLKIEQYRAAADDLSEKLKQIDEYKNDLMTAAKFPIDGLSFGDNLVKYDDLPLDQASTTVKLQVSLAVGMAINPDLRVLMLDEATGIDKAHMKVIEDMAKEKDFQVWMTITDESGQVGVFIEDGEVKTVNQS